MRCHKMLLSLDKYVYEFLVKKKINKQTDVEIFEFYRVYVLYPE